MGSNTSENIIIEQNILRSLAHVADVDASASASCHSFASSTNPHAKYASLKVEYKIPLMVLKSSYDVAP